MPQLICAAAEDVGGFAAAPIFPGGKAWGIPYAPDVGFLASLFQPDSPFHKAISEAIWDAPHPKADSRDRAYACACAALALVGPPCAPPPAAACAAALAALTVLWAGPLMPPSRPSIRFLPMSKNTDDGENTPRIFFAIPTRLLRNPPSQCRMFPATFLNPFQNSVSAAEAKLPRVCPSPRSEPRIRPGSPLNQPTIVPRAWIWAPIVAAHIAFQVTATECRRVSHVCATSWAQLRKSRVALTTQRATSTCQLARFLRKPPTTRPMSPKSFFHSTILPLALPITNVFTSMVPAMTVSSPDSTLIEFGDADTRISFPTDTAIFPRPRPRAVIAGPDRACNWARNALNPAVWANLPKLFSSPSIAFPAARANGSRSGSSLPAIFSPSLSTLNVTGASLADSLPNSTCRDWIPWTAWRCGPVRSAQSCRMCFSASDFDALVVARS